MQVAEELSPEAALPLPPAFLGVRNGRSSASECAGGGEGGGAQATAPTDSRQGWGRLQPAQPLPWEKDD